MTKEKVIRTDDSMSPRADSFNFPEIESNYTAEHRLIKANASKACAQCPGYCCMAFSLSFSLEELPGRVARFEARLRALLDDLEKFYQHWEISHFRDTPLSPEWQQRWTRAHQEADIALEDLYTLDFFKNRLIPLKDAKDNHGPIQRLYTCKAFDLATRRCTEYENRPLTCRRYVCGSAVSGFPPPFTTMMVQHSASLLRKMKRLKMVIPDTLHRYRTMLGIRRAWQLNQRKASQELEHEATKLKARCDPSDVQEEIQELHG